MSISDVAGLSRETVDWPSVPYHLVEAELRRRQDGDAKPECGSKGGRGAYNMPAHVFALVLILVLSTGACAFPIIARRFPGLSIPHRFLFLSRHFGTGVLIATAFVHLLPTAFVSLTDPCLPDFWSKGYRPAPGAIAMTAVLLVVGIEMFFATRGAGHVHGSEWEQPPHQHDEDDEGGGGGGGGGLHDHEHGRGQPNGQSKEARNGRVMGSAERPTALHKLRHGSHAGLDGAAEERAGGGVHREPDARVWDDLPPSSRPLLAPALPPAVDTASPAPDSDDEARLSFSGGRPGAASPHNHTLLDVHGPANDADDDDRAGLLHHPQPVRPVPHPSLSPYTNSPDPAASPTPQYPSPTPARPRGSHDAPGGESGGGGGGGGLSPQALARKLLLQCLLLEAGILFHSVFIGMSVSVTTGPAFVVLLVAISFHQTFEGLALGARIAAIPALAPTSPKPWLMALAYGTTTPIGQAVGLAIHGLYDPHSTAGLLMVGIMNAISSGLLLFAGLVELLAEDFLSDQSYRVLKGRRRLEACAAVVAGAFLMAVVGAFA